MGKEADREGLSLGYRIMYRIKYVGMHVFGPAQLGEQQDPHMRVKRQGEPKVAAARKAGLARDGKGSAGTATDRSH